MTGPTELLDADSVDPKSKTDLKKGELSQAFASKSEPFAFMRELGLNEATQIEFFNGQTSEMSIGRAMAIQSNDRQLNRYGGTAGNANIGGAGGNATANLAAEVEERKKFDDFREDFGEMLAVTGKVWDDTMSTMFPGLTNAQALDALKKFNADADRNASDAVKRGLIKPGEEEALKEYMRLQQLIMEQERKFGKADPALIAKRDDVAASSPGVADAGNKIVSSYSMGGRTALSNEAQDATTSQNGQLSAESVDNADETLLRAGKVTSSASDFPSAPDLTEHYERAEASKVPLDNKEITLALNDTPKAETPAQKASVQVSYTAGF